jgi:hypothetical protein
MGVSGMKNKSAMNYIIFAVVVCFFIIGCAAGSKIMMSSDRYSPSFRSSDFSRLKGKKLILSSFYNQAQNTKAWSYNSADNKYLYEGNAQLETYYWNCFYKAFKHAGVNLLDYTYAGYRGPHPYWWGAAPPPQAPQAKGIPEFQLILTSLTDQEFRFKALLLKDGQTKFEKEFTVTMKSAGTENVGELEKRSYNLVDIAFTTIMKDHEFQKSF